VRPASPPLPNDDSWLLADEGLDALENVQKAVHDIRARRFQIGGEYHGTLEENLEIAAEMLKRLAWGEGHRNLGSGP
jgi:hypothetical protein